ncbi:MAG: hypothetical protein HZC38_07310 [Chloroflexi bacterium]|nr:hypothetical protein [Chloroflexota bacterium]MBI5082771.1 hypothetical protein [Chloroflexota bacterium]MBI5350219.1 hypothetical protein [Chloroflexota bacterium]MBI5713216.1 hypothetical protein [Chloroflexota bacterium]
MILLERYLARLEETIRSRKEIEIEELEIERKSKGVERSAEFYARLSFYDDSRLEASEKLSVERNVIVKTRYAYHYQDKDDKAIFRYDNVPHHPEVKTHPHHKHLGDKVLATEPPDLSEVLREIDKILYEEMDG